MGPTPGSSLSRIAAAGLAMACAAALVAAGDGEGKGVVSVTTRDAAGAAVRVPLPDRTSVLLFVRTDQEQSTVTVEGLKKVLEEAPPVQVLAVLSGDISLPRTEAFAKGLPCPLVQDRDFKVVGQLRIRVWPTTVIVLPDGKELVRIAGLPPSYVSDLSAYLAFAAKRIDRKTLEHRLAASSVVADSPYQRARRHLQVARRLLARDELGPASLEVDRGLKVQPKDAGLLLAKARLLLLQQKPGEALTVLGRLDENTALAARIDILRGGALVAMKQWDRAIQVLQQAVKLNPNPSEGYYFLGMALRHKQQWAGAAEAFRKAYESDAAGRLISRSLQQPPSRPASQPGSQPATSPGPE